MQGPLKAVKIRVVGIVQGVGFRPFVYRLARSLGLRGYVVNLGGSEVEIHIEGPLPNVLEFIDRLKRDKPPRAKILNLFLEDVEVQEFREFMILDSLRLTTFRSVIPPDIAICDECVKEILNPQSRFYRYPWNSCVWCGPRFSMMYTVPYDRRNTAMRDFKLCDKCLRSYTDPEDLRRFHGQGISCPRCGPKTLVFTSDGTKIDVDDPIEFIAEKINEGAIVAIKGVGGYHIACLASRDDVVAKLRLRKGRPYQPFALMAKDFETVTRIAIPVPGARNLLESPQRPIVILPRRPGARVSDLVAPGLSTIGVMLPYTGFQVLLLNEIPDGYLIMTSGNIHGEPMCTDLDCVTSKLGSVVDYIVEHERAIVHRVDDSVIRFADGEAVFLRRSRGYAPEWIEVPLELPDIVALGAELQTAGAVAFEKKVVLTQYIGDLDNLEALEDLKKEIAWFISVYNVKPKIIAIDMHPLYHNRIIARELSEKLGAQIVEIQHHHAHAVAVLGEHQVDRDSRVVAITIDGVGYGPPGEIWGGEVLLTTYKYFNRLGSLHPFVLPGGDSATINPLKSLVALMAATGLSEEETLSILAKLGLLEPSKDGYTEAAITYMLARKGIGVTTSSMGRTLDAFAALLGVCLRRTYEGEPPMRLESAADRAEKELEYAPKITTFYDRFVVDVPGLLLWILDKLGQHRVEDLALTVLKGLGKGIAMVALKSLKGLRNTEQFVVMSGGAAVNTYIVRGVKEVLGEEGIGLLLPRRVPPGDGGIALGQALVASQVAHLEQ